MPESSRVAPSRASQKGVLAAARKCAGLLGALGLVLSLVTGALPSGQAAAALSSRAGTGALSVLVEPSKLGSDAGMQPVYSFVLSAKRSVDMTMYELGDEVMMSDLVTDKRRGVKVRVILDTNREHSRNLAAFNILRAGGVKVAWAAASYEATHQKTITVDGTRSLILTANLTSEYYTTTRDFGIFDTNPADVAAIEAVFNADFAHVAITPSHGADLVWSPGSEAAMLAVINGARHTLSIENEEMGDSAITAAIAAAAKRGVKVEVTMTADSSYDSALGEIVHAGGSVHLYADDSSDLYIHAKTTIADAGRSTERIYVGSINFSSASMDRNRELGVITTLSTIVDAINAVVSADFTQCAAATDCRSYD
jgi:phosphatidylserine/phosphatidylglycerophosphate/cardiolipin synthase-like enzyme